MGRVRECIKSGGRLFLEGLLTPPRLVRRQVWLARYRKRFRQFEEISGTKSLSLFGLERCEIRYINLSRRVDRRDSQESEFRRLGLAHFSRFNAVEAKLGILGCAISHSTVLRRPALAREFLMVCEDDVVFSGSRAELDRCIEEFGANKNLDVLCLAYNLTGRSKSVSERLSITNDTQTTSCYVLKEGARSDLQSTFQKSAELLAAGRDVRRFAPDILWKKLQNGKYFFAVPTSRMAKQRPSFSDIEQRHVDYGV